jgi:hypothetical protein
MLAIPAAMFITWGWAQAKIDTCMSTTNFDIFAAAGAMNKATIQQFTVNANAAGQYVIQFTSVIDKSLVSGIEIQ